MLNNAHPNLQFTMETTTNALPFLDVSVSIEDEVYQTKVYRKPTNTGVLMNFESMALLKWKISFIRCLLNRAYRISSGWNHFNSEVEQIKSILQQNEYPISFINDVCHGFMEAHNINEENFGVERDTYTCNRTTDHTEAYVVIPFVGRPSIKLQNRIRKTMEPLRIRVSPAYRTTKVGSYFNLKSSCPQLF